MRARVFVVDDDADVRFLVRRVLSRDGWDVVGEVSDGRQAVDGIRRLHPEVVLLDLRMPTAGETVLPQILATAPSCMVVIFTSLAPIDGHAERLLQMGAWAYYDKSEVRRLPQLLAADYEQFHRCKH